MEIKGFANKREVEASELESQLGCDFEQRNEKDIYFIHKDKLCEVHVGNGTKIGYYRGTTLNGAVVLLPHIIYEFIPLTEDDMSKGRGKYRWENERPSMIPIHAVTGMDTISKEYTQQRVDGVTLEKLNQISNKQANKTAC